ncbi:hypothetical protein Bca52824_018869 [Brassica carinata]|uniref:Uncharacterized protein n=1 Tax=Brassica carinata TaxID=52824 RepID=A0A8X8AZV5_BRACI|nr:hypothetical protein Bca52824_018869 [Brassica carinata]
MGHCNTNQPKRTSGWNFDNEPLQRTLPATRAVEDLGDVGLVENFSEFGLDAVVHSSRLRSLFLSLVFLLLPVVSCSVSPPCSSSLGLRAISGELPVRERPLALTGLGFLCIIAQSIPSDTGGGFLQRSLGSWFSVVTSGGGGSRGVIDRLRVTP